MTLVSLTLLQACVSDVDGDGLRKRLEHREGTDPFVADTDGDGLLDGEEIDRGTSPLKIDTDEDGYTDSDEIDAGTDPLDPTDVIYLGGWPYSADKDLIADPGFGGTARAGDTMPRFTALDQFGQEVDIYDFAGTDDIVVFELCDMATWVCGTIAEWRQLGTDPAPPVAPWLDEWAPVRRAMNAGRLWVVTVLVASEAGVEPDVDDVDAWGASYPHERNLVVADSGARIFDWATQHRDEPAAFMWWQTNDQMRLVDIDEDSDPTYGWTMYSLAASLP